jgi:hypothetical protein
MVLCRVSHSTFIPMCLGTLKARIRHPHCLELQKIHWGLHMRKKLRRSVVRRKGSHSKSEHPEGPLLDVAVQKPIPSRARVLLLGLASAALESAVSDDSQMFLVGFSLLRETFRELESTVEQMSRDSGAVNRSLRKGPGKNTEVPEHKKPQPANR